MTKRYFPAILTLLWLAAPAAATVREDAACVAGRLSATERPALVDDAEASRQAETLALLNPPLDACSQGQNWTLQRRADTAAYAIGLVVSGEMRQRLAAHGINAAVLDRWFARQSEIFRTTAFLTLDNNALQAAFETLSGHEVSAAAMERDGASIGGYLSALVIMERIGRGLGM